eukprot:gene6664-7363_t
MPNDLSKVSENWLFIELSRFLFKKINQDVEKALIDFCREKQLITIDHHQLHNIHILCKSLAQVAVNQLKTNEWLLTLISQSSGGSRNQEEDDGQQPEESLPSQSQKSEDVDENIQHDDTNNSSSLYEIPTAEQEVSGSHEEKDQTSYSTRFFAVLSNLTLSICPSHPLDLLIDNCAELNEEEKPLFRKWLREIVESRLPLAMDQKLILDTFHKAMRLQNENKAPSHSKVESEKVFTKPLEQKETKRPVGRPRSSSSQPKKKLTIRQRQKLDDEKWMAHLEQLIAWESTHGSLNVPRQAVVEADGISYSLGEWLEGQRILMDQYYKKDTERYEILSNLAERGLWTSAETPNVTDSRPDAPAPAPSIPPEDQEEEPVLDYDTSSHHTLLENIDISATSRLSIIQPCALQPRLSSSNSKVAQKRHGPSARDMTKSSSSDSPPPKISKLNTSAAQLSISSLLSPILVNTSIAQKEMDSNPKRRIIYQLPIKSNQSDHFASDSGSDSDYEPTSVQKKQQMSLASLAAGVKEPSKPMISRQLRKSQGSFQTESSDEDNNNPDSHPASDEKGIRMPRPCAKILKGPNSQTEKNGFVLKSGQHILFRRSSGNGQKSISIGMVANGETTNDRKECEVHWVKSSLPNSFWTSSFTLHSESKLTVDYADILATSIELQHGRLTANSRDCIDDWLTSLSLPFS